VAVELRVVASGHDGEGWDYGVKGQAQRRRAGPAIGKGDPGGGRGRSEDDGERVLHCEEENTGPHTYSGHGTKSRWGQHGWCTWGSWADGGRPRGHWDASSALL
jgi:hypothetical protein